MRLIDSVKSKLRFGYDDSDDQYDEDFPYGDDYEQDGIELEEADGSHQNIPPVRNYSHRDPERLVKIVDRASTTLDRGYSQSGSGYNADAPVPAESSLDDPDWLRNAGEAPSVTAVRRSGVYGNGNSSQGASAYSSAPAGISVVSPSSYNDAEAVTRTIKASGRLVLSLKQVRPELGKRILDFSFGVASALGCKADKIDDRVWYITKGAAALSNDELRQLQSSGVIR